MKEQLETETPKMNQKHNYRIKEVASLIEEYEAISDRYINEIDESNRIRLRRKMERLEKQIQELQE
jgi:hypothetical protein